MNYQDVCVQWNMDDNECRAYQISLIWHEYVQKLFPQYRTRKLKKGDPRKSLIFRYCYKLLTETKGLILENEYPLYVKAQLTILKSVTFDDNTHPQIEPSILVGEKAWWRWKKFKRLYDHRTGQVTNQQVDTPFAKVRDALDRTKFFLFTTFASDPTLEKYQEAITNKNLFRWINIGKISPYYLAISPFIKKLFPDGFGKEVSVDLDVYRAATNTKEIQDYFQSQFPHEVTP